MARANKNSIKHISSSFRFMKSQVEIREYGQYSTIILQDGIPNGLPGQPALPWSKFYLSIPWDAAPGNLTLDNIKTAVIAESILIEPLQPSVPAFMHTEAKWIPPNSGLYASDAAYPDVFARLAATRRLAGFSMVELQVSPFKYYPRSGKLEMIESFDLDLTYTQSGKKLVKPRSVIELRHEWKLADRVRGMVLNPDQVKLHRPFEGGTVRDFNVPRKIDFVIITSKSLALAFKRLSNWRTRMGLQSKVVTLEDIKANNVEGTEDSNGKKAVFWHATGYQDGGTRDDAEAIRNFIKWAEINWLTQYVLLGGDTNIIPCRCGIHTGTIDRWRLNEGSAFKYWDINKPDIDAPWQDVVASKVLGSSIKADSTHAANNANDGDPNNSWECAPEDNDPSILLEFEKAIPINYLVLSWGATYAKSYEIQVSNDKSNWTTLYDTTSGSGGIEKLKLPCTNSKYLLLKIKGGTNFSLREIRAMKAYCGKDSKNKYYESFPGKNQLGMLPQASSNSSSAGNVLDADEGSSWSCSPEDTEPYIQLTIPPLIIPGHDSDHLHHTAVNCILLKWSGKVPSYVLKASTNGSDFETIDLLDSKPSIIEERYFKKCISFPKGGRIRLYISGGSEFSLVSMGLYGPPSSGWGGVIYRINDTTSRIYLHKNGLINPDPINPEKGDRLFILTNGTVINYNRDASDIDLGWYYVEDLVNGVKSDLPTRYMEIRGPAEFHSLPEEDLRPYLILVQQDNYIPADLYYSHISADDQSAQNNHDWDLDGNRIYGENCYLVYSKDIDQWGNLLGYQWPSPHNLDTGIAHADIFLGRAPVSTPAEAQTFIEKVICYEKFEDQEGYPLPSDFAVSVLLGSANWYGGSGDWGDPLDRSAKQSEEIRKTLKGSYWKFTRRYEDYADVPEQDKGPDLAGANEDSMMNALMKGNNIVSLMSHGGPEGCCFIQSEDHEVLQGNEIITKQGICSIENIPGVFFACACYTGEFDYQNIDKPQVKSLGETAVLNPYGGAVAYVGASRMGSTGDGPMNIAFWRRLIEESASGRLGDMFNTCKEITPCWGGWQTYTWNLLGDPAMRVWSDRPKRLKVTYPREICTGNQTFEVTVKSSDNIPVKDAVVSLTMNESVLTTGFTNASGKGYLKITPFKIGTIYISVSGKNLIPFRGDSSVVKCETQCSKKILPPGTCYPSLLTCNGYLPTHALECYPAIYPKDINSQDLIKGWKDLVMNPSYIDAIWGIRDVKEFVKQADRPEIKKVLEELPLETRKPIKMMLTRMKKEMKLD